MVATSEIENLRRRMREHDANIKSESAAAELPAKGMTLHRDFVCGPDDQTALRQLLAQVEGQSS